MYVNRITFSIYKPDCSSDQLKEFNQIGSYLEELLFHHMKGKANCGGFGFFHNIIQRGNHGTQLKAYGQIIDFKHIVGESEIKNFFELDLPGQINYLLDKLEKSIEEISQKFSVDFEKFRIAINNSRKTELSFEQKLKVSKNFKNRIHRIDIIREVAPKEENILCRIISSKNDLIDEFYLETDTSVHDASYNFRKSKWEGTELKIYNRLEEVSHSIDMNKYLK